MDTNWQSVGGTGIGQDGQATNGNNGQASPLQPMQMCTCSAGVTNATYSGSAQIRLRGGNNSGKLVFKMRFPARVHSSCWHGVVHACEKTKSYLCASSEALSCIAIIVARQCVNNLFEVFSSCSSRTRCSPVNLNSCVLYRSTSC